KVAISVTTLDPKLARTMEPRATTPPRRLEALRQLAAAGVPTSVMVAPVIPAINDAEIERILDAAAAAGVQGAGYVLLRLPLEVRDLFREWLIANFPDRYRHVFKLIRDMRGGKDYDSEFGKRMTGSGPIAWMIGRRFEAACEKLGLNQARAKLTTEHFSPPRSAAAQLTLFWHGRAERPYHLADALCRQPGEEHGVLRGARVPSQGTQRQGRCVLRGRRGDPVALVGGRTGEGCRDHDRGVARLPRHRACLELRLAGGGRA